MNSLSGVIHAYRLLFNTTGKKSVLMKVAPVRWEQSVYPLLWVSTLIVLLGVTVVVKADEGRADNSEMLYQFDIPSQPVNRALGQLARQTRHQLLFPSELVGHHQSNALKGQYSLAEALIILLQGTSLSGSVTERGVIIITAPNSNTLAIEGNGAMNNRKKLLAAVIGFFAGSQAVYGQQEAQTAEAQWLLEEVVVTATKRSQNLQDVAFGLSAKTEESLQRIGAYGAGDYLLDVPGVSFTEQGRNRSPIIIRGISTDGDTVNDQQKTTAIYIDDLPSLQSWGAWINTDPNVFDVERVEVLRGPQGTLFGSGSLGGAVRIINNKPGYDGFAGKLGLDQAFIEGGDSSTAVNTMLNIPLVEDKLALRLVAYGREEGGYIDNVRYNEKNINGSDTYGGRALLGYQASEDLELRLTVTHQSDEVDDVPKVFSDQVDGGDYEYDAAMPQSADTNMTIYNFAVDYNLGSMALVSSTTYADRDNKLLQDLAEGAAAIFDIEDNSRDNFEAFIDEEVETFAQEFRLSSQQQSALEWIVGAFYLDQSIDTYQLWASKELDEPIYGGIFLSDIEELALFGEVTYHLSEQWSATLGGRWFDNTFAFEVPLQTGIFGAPPSPRVEQTESKFTSKFSLSFRPTEDVHLYAVASQGLRIGQVNFGVTFDDGVPSVPPTYDSDTLWNYELGIKSYWFDQQLKLNMALFYIDWEDIQLTSLASNGLNFVDNVGNAVSEGGEIELVYLPFEGVEFGSSITYVDAELKSVEKGGLAEKGSTLPGTPDLSVANYLQYTHNNFNRDMSAYLRLSHRYFGEVYSSINNDDLLASDSYNVFDLRAGMYIDQYEVVLYIDNVTNNDAVTNRIEPNFGDPSYFAYRLKPRTAGITFRMEF